MSESLRNDGRIWVPKKAEDCEKDPREIPEQDRDYYLERIYPSFGNLVPRDIASRQAKNVCDEGRGVGPKVGDFRRGVYLDFTDALKRMSADAVAEKYGNLLDMYQRITGREPLRGADAHLPRGALHDGRSLGRLRPAVTIPGLFVAGEANFSDHGANRLGASALMQGLGDGYFVLPHTIRDYLAKGPFDKLDESHPAVAEAHGLGRARVQKLLSINGDRSVDSFHRELGNIMWEYCGMERSEEGLLKAIDLIRGLRDEFWRNVKVLGAADTLNQSLEKAGRVADFLELGELMCIDALHRRESCGGHFRAESQTEDGEALRHDEEYRLCRGLGVGWPGRRADPAQGRPGLRIRRDEAAELQVSGMYHLMKLTLKIWRQAGPATKGEMVTYPVSDISEDMSFLEMLDVLNEQLNARGEEPIAFDSDCREGICGMCGLMISGKAHGPEVTTTCQLHMRTFSDGDEITIEPWRADAFPVIKDLVVDRSSFDRIIQAGGYISANTGSAPEAHSVPVPKHAADRSFMAAACIGCGACVAACPNASGMLFLGAKITHLGELPQGQPERDARVVNMVTQHDDEGFGGCTNIGECSSACPKEIPLDVINQLNKDLRHALIARPVTSRAGGPVPPAAPVGAPSGHG